LDRKRNIKFYLYLVTTSCYIFLKSTDKKEAFGARFKGISNCIGEQDNTKIESDLLVRPTMKKK